MRILIAEDERDLNRLIVKVLEKEGYGGGRLLRREGGPLLFGEHGV